MDYAANQASSGERVVVVINQRGLLGGIRVADYYLRERI